MAEPLRIPIKFVGPENQELSLGEFVAIRKDVLARLEAVAESARRAQRFLSQNPGANPSADYTQSPEYQTMDLIRELQGRLDALSAADQGLNVITESSTE